MSQEIEIVHKHIADCVKAFNKKHPKYKIYQHKNAVNMGMGESGHPDFTLLVCGVMIGMEAKWDMLLQDGSISANKKNLPTPHQAKRLQEIEEAGGYSCVVDRNNMHWVSHLLEAISDHKSRTAEYDCVHVIKEVFPTLNYTQYCKELRGVDL